MAQSSMLFWSFFKSLAEQGESTGYPPRLVIELKSGVKVQGSLDQVDESLNFNLSDVHVFPPETSLKDA